MKDVRAIGSAMQASARLTRISMAILAGFASFNALAACPFALANQVVAAAPRDGRDLAQFTRRDSAAALLSFEQTTHAHVAANLSRLDIDADGVFTTTDSIVIVRSLLGFRDNALTDGLTIAGNRSSVSAIQSFLDTGCAADSAMQSKWQSASFTESSAVINNPERGFWIYLSEDFLTVTDGTLAGVQATWPDVSLGYAYVRLDAYRNQTLPQLFFDALNEKFAIVRARGMKLILRFSYNNGGVSPAGDDAPMARVLEHINQIAPHVQANADVVYVWQGGFIGAYGEQHSSSNGLDTLANKTIIRDALLNVLPANRYLLWRDPKDQIAWDADPGSEIDAFGASRQARMGMYNDCFLASDTDVGTYSEDATLRAQQRAYVVARSAIVPFGGETCNAQVNLNQQRKTCADILGEGAQFHLSYLNRTYAPTFISQWQTEGCFTEIAQKMGYRWVLTNATSSKSVARGAATQLSITLKNVGWARMYNARPLTVRLISRSTPAAPDIVGTAVWDARLLKPNNETSALFTINIPPDAPVGAYDVVVASPDPSPSIANVAAYAVRFANADNAAAAQSWNSVTGHFATGLTIAIE
jgi:Domain of unknown function (DUF4832)/Domain of unknown function (DUF4874)